MDIQRILTNLDNEFDNTTDVDLAEEISRKRKELLAEEEALSTTDTRIKKAFMAKTCDLSLGRLQETPLQKSQRELHQKLYPDFTLLPDILDFPIEYTIKITEQVDKLSKLRQDLADLLNDKYQSLINSKPYTIGSTLTKESFSYLI